MGRLLGGGIYKRAAFKRGNMVDLFCIFNASAKFYCIEAIVIIVREKPLDFIKTDLTKKMTFADNKMFPTSIIIRLGMYAF